MRAAHQNGMLVVTMCTGEFYPRYDGTLKASVCSLVDLSTLRQNIDHFPMFAAL
jgi:hypothetical protein